MQRSRADGRKRRRERGEKPQTSSGAKKPTLSTRPRLENLLSLTLSPLSSLSLFSFSSLKKTPQVLERREEIDWSRHIAFSAFGIIYLGGFQYWLYNIKFSQLCAPLTARFGHAAVAPIKVFLDQGLHHPLLYFPFFYGLKAFVEGKPMSSAVDKYKREIKDSCLALWKIWVPAQLVNFAFVPRHLRIPYVAAVSFGWTVVLSTMQGRYAKEEQEQQAAAGSSAVDKFGKESQELMANIVATGGIPSPASSSGAPKKGGDAASLAASLSAPSRQQQQLGGLKDIAAEAAGNGSKKEGARGSSPAIVAASRAEAAALVAGCATGTGSGAAAA